MKKLLLFLSAVLLIGFSSCNKFKTTAHTGREFLLRQGPKTQHIGPGVTQFTGERGMSFSVSGPYISLATGDTIEGQPEFWLVEYLNKKDMMYGGLSTTSGGYVIVTGGAFSLATRVNGQLVRPSNVLFQVPADLPNPEMSIFKGVNSESTISWLPPSPIELATLAIVDSTSTGGPGYGGSFYPYPSWYLSGVVRINCDYFLNSSEPLTDISVRPESGSSFSSLQLSVSLLFDNEEVYMNGWYNPVTSLYGFPNLPIGESVNCIAVGVDSNEELYYGPLAFEVEENGVYTFQMEQVTEEELEDILDAL